MPADGGDLAEPFQTPYELSLAAECLADTGGVASRAALFEASVLFSRNSAAFGSGRLRRPRPSRTWR